MSAANTYVIPKIPLVRNLGEIPEKKDTGHMATIKQTFSLGIQSMRSAMRAEQGEFDIGASSRNVHKLWRDRRLRVALFALWLWGCTRYVPMDDPSLKPFADMYAVERGRYGFSPLPRNAKVEIDQADATDHAMGVGYDVMLHIYDKDFRDKTYRVVAFLKKDGVYKWAGEQEKCLGPREYKSVNGVFQEDLTISFFHHAAHHLEGLHISYTGPDRSLSFREIPIPEAKRVLKQWGCE